MMILIKELRRESSVQDAHPYVKMRVFGWDWRATDLNPSDPLRAALDPWVGGKNHSIWLLCLQTLYVQ